MKKRFEKSKKSVDICRSMLYYIRVAAREQSDKIRTLIIED